MDGILKALGFDSKPDYTEKIPETLTPDNFFRAQRKLKGGMSIARLFRILRCKMLILCVRFCIWYEFVKHEQLLQYAGVLACIGYPIAVWFKYNGGLPITMGRV